MATAMIDGSPTLAEHKTDVNGLMQLAVDRGAGADALEKIAGVIERRERWDAERAFNEAMCRCQAELPAVVKNARNPQTNSDYAKLEAIGAAIDPIIHKHGFSQSFGTADSPLEGFIRVVCDLRHRDGHSQRYQLDLPPDGAGIKGSVNKTPVHAIGSSLHYGERYLTCMMFKVRLTGRDNDGNGNREEVINEQEIALINEWLESANGNLERLLKWAGVDSLAEFPKSKLQGAIDGLKAKAKQR